MNKSQVLAVPVALALAGGGLVACGTDTGYDAYCVQQSTQLRVIDASCNNGNGYFWYYIPYGKTYPSVGQRATGGSSSTPTSGSVSRGKLPTSSGKATSAPKGSTKVTPAKPPKVDTKKGGSGGSQNKPKNNAPKAPAPKAPAPKAPGKVGK